MLEVVTADIPFVIDVAIASDVHESEDGEELCIIGAVMNTSPTSSITQDCYSIVLFRSVVVCRVRILSSTTC